MSQSIHVHDIQISSLSNPHVDLPMGMQMFAQIICDETIIHQTEPVDTEDSVDLSWKLSINCEVPSHALTFWIAILRENPGPRLLGFIAIQQGEAILSAEQQTAFHMQLVPVNSDGPLLHLNTFFSVSSGPAIQIEDMESEDMESEDMESAGFQMGSWDSETITDHLAQMLDDTSCETQLHPDDMSLMHELILLLPYGSSDRGGFLHLLGDVCLQQWEGYSVRDMLNRAVWAFEDAIRDGLTDPTCLEYFGIALLRRFEQLGDASDISKATVLLEQAVNLTPDSNSDKLSWMTNLGGALVRRFQCLGDLDDLHKSISLGENAIGLAPDSQVDKPVMLNNLATSLLLRFKQLGDLADLNSCVVRGEEALLLTPDDDSDKPARLNNLGDSLLTRFNHVGDMDDLKKSVVMAENAVLLTPDGNLDKPYWLTNLGNSLSAHFKHLGAIDDLNKAVLMHENAVHLTQDDNPNKPLVLTNLATSLWQRFGCLGDRADLNSSILRAEAAVLLTPDSHPIKPLRLENLGVSLITRFELLGGLDDLNRSVLKAEDAVNLTSDANPAKASYLDNLSSCLFRRFERLGTIDDLHKSVLMREKAIQLTPEGHIHKSFWLNNLGGSFVSRFIRLGDPSDLNKSVVMLKDAVDWSKDDHPSKPLILSNFSNSLLARFGYFKELGDLKESVLMQRNAVGLTPNGHPDKPLLLFNLGNSLLTQFNHLGDQLDLQQAILHYTAAACATTGSPDIRFDAASSWAQCARLGKHSSLLEAYQVALDLLPELAWLGLSIKDRHYHLLKAGKVVREAAAAATVSGQAKKAVEWLEQGRSVIWGQLLNLRTPVDILKNSHPKLADQLLFLSSKLDISGTCASDIYTSRPGMDQSLRESADQAHQNAHNREELLKQIRGLDGFSRFLLPRSFSELSLAANQGPVVILNITDSQCDALILKPGIDEVMHIPLTAFPPSYAEELMKHLGDLVGRGGRLFGEQEGKMDQEDQFALILSGLWSGVVQPVLEALDIKTPVRSNLKRIWWCPTGSLVFLPIHAAGNYAANDIFGSNWFSIRHQVRTQEEIAHIQRLALGKFTVLRLDEEMATVQSVQQGMIESRWVHFACHGVQNVSNPTESALLLAGTSHFTLESIIRLALPHADFAFLSACQTATGDRTLQEESVHLAAGMLLAGYRGVIATMWTIRDDDAPQVACDVYEHLFKISPPDATQAAEALHLAIQRLREGSGKKSFTYWVPFIHIGV
ncbi:CHAT domain-containing protein [Mycena rebaudengoi]|nr:CHAT domain-containing protein [Mycena rebaudengoi]